MTFGLLECVRIDSLRLIYAMRQLAPTHAVAALSSWLVAWLLILLLHNRLLGTTTLGRFVETLILVLSGP